MSNFELAFPVDYNHRAHPPNDLIFGNPIFLLRFGQNNCQESQNVQML